MMFIAPSSVSLKLMSLILTSERRLNSSVSHNGLLSKLWCIGIRGKIWCWLQAYVSRRLQYISINGNKSNLLPLISGSILGPLLFLIFINDLPDSASSSAMLLYADDAKCYRPIANPSDCQLLQDDLCRLFDWSLEWKLKFNIPMCVRRFVFNV